MKMKNMLLVVLGVAVGAALFWAMRGQKTEPSAIQSVAQSSPPASEPPPASAPEPAAPPGDRIPAYYASAAAARPLPTTLSPELFDHPAVARAYRVAQRIPEVLAQQPCYCYCDQQGHRGLLDCFVTSHGAG